MFVIEGVEALEPDLGAIFVVVGVFDGLHLGHAYLLRHLVREAAARAARPTVITFDHHPAEVLASRSPSSSTSMRPCEAPRTTSSSSGSARASVSVAS
jgi:riboflavin kinase/FMN adenylyltransferase